MTRAFGTGLLLAVAVFALYGRVLEAPFIFDDRPAVVENESIRRLWPLVGDASVRGPLNPPPLAPTARRPLTNLTFALNYRVGGLAPAGYRLVNLLLHLLVAIVLASLVRQTLRLPYFGTMWERTAWPASVAVALIWAVHPLVSEAVVGITQRSELLAALAYLLTLWAAVQYWAASAPLPRGMWMVAAGVAAAAGMASKEIAASVPVVVWLYERTFLVGTWRDTRRSWPLYLTLALAWVLLVLLSAGGVSGLSDARHQVPVAVWWMTQAKVMLLYGKLVVWPWPLSIHYAPKLLPTLAAAWPWLTAWTMAAGASLALGWRRPAVRFLIVAVALVLAPTSLIPLPKMVVAERRMYLPLAGVVALALLGAYRLLESRWSGASDRVAAVALTALVVALSGLTAARLGAYETAVTIWQDSVRHQPDDAMGHYNLGVALLDEHRPPAEVMASFLEAVRLDPDHAGARVNLGLVLNRLGQPEAAREHLEHALTLEPDDVMAHNNLGIVLTALGRSEDAIRHLQRALALETGPPAATVHINLGTALLATGASSAALAHFEDAVRLRPDDPDTHYNLGAALMRVGRLAEATGAFEQALERAPDDVEARNNLAATLLRMGETGQAVEHYRRALRDRPDRPDLYSNLGTALLVAGQRAEAIARLEEAIRRAPEHGNARRNLARALMEDGRPREAIAQWRQILRLDPNDAQARFTCAQALASADDPHAAMTMAEEARALASARGEPVLVAEIDAWLATRPPAPN